MIESRVIKMPANKMLASLFLNYGKSWTLMAVSGLVVFILLGCAVDIRFLVVALIWLFLFVPLVMAFLYFYYGMNPLTAFNTMPHRLFVSPDKLTVRIIEKEEDKENSIPETFKDYDVSCTDFMNIKIGLTGYLLFFKNKGFLWMPVDSYKSSDELNKVLDYLRTNN